MRSIRSDFKMNVEWNCPKCDKPNKQCVYHDELDGNKLLCGHCGKTSIVDDVMSHNTGPVFYPHYEINVVD